MDVPQVHHRLRARRGDGRGRDEEVPMATLGARSWSGCRASRPVARRLRERLPSASPRRGSSPGSASTASSRPSPRSRRSAADFSSKNDRNDAARWPRRYCRNNDISLVWVPSPRSRGSGPRRGPRRGDREARRRSSGSPAFPARRGYAYGGTTPAGNPGGTGTYDFLRWLDKVRGPPTTAASGRLRR